jgi:hypothetical protein
MPAHASRHQPLDSHHRKNYTASMDGIPTVHWSLGQRCQEQLRSNRFFIPHAHEQIAGAFAVRAFFIAVISGCFTLGTFDPVRCFFGNCVNAVAALSADDFAATAVCDPLVVSSAAALCATRNRQVSLHFLMIRLRWCFHAWLYRPETSKPLVTIAVPSGSAQGPVIEFPSPRRHFPINTVRSRT